MLFFHVLFWVTCLKIQEKKPILFGQGVELGLLGFGCLAGWALGRLPGQSSHFFIGYGVTLLQCARLVRGLNPREKRISVILAMLQIGVACTVVLDYRFILLLVGICILIPKALMEMSAEYFSSNEEGRRGGIGTKGTMAVLGVMLVFFLVFPRGLLSGAAGAFQPAGGTSGTFLDSVLDPSRSGNLGSSKPVLQIKGEQLGYLRSFALSDFRDGVWKADVSPLMRRISMPDDAVEENLLPRKVRVKDVRFLGRSLPADGHVVNIEGNFFRRPLQSIHGNIECSEVWNTSRNVYDYLMEPSNRHDYMLPKWKRRFLRAPEPSDAVEEWVSAVLAGEEDDFQKAVKLETHLQNEFTYDLGAPELNRLKALDDFLLEERRGHCERFASALALLLRMQGIPTRVMVGYVPGPANVLTGWTTVRQMDAHAWTEAFFDDRGWVTLDATPRSEMDLGVSAIRELLDALDAVWYVNIVNMDSGAQKNLFVGAGRLIAIIPIWFVQRPVLIAGLVLLILVVMVIRNRGQLGIVAKEKDEVVSEDAKRIQYAEDFYGRFLMASAEAGYVRDTNLTPYEFVRELRLRDVSFLSSAEKITEPFCKMRYGNEWPDEEVLTSLNERIKAVNQPQSEKSKESSISHFAKD